MTKAKYPPRRPGKLKHRIEPCPRCGIPRMIREERATNYLCVDCKYTEPGWPDVLGGPT